MDELKKTLKGCGFGVSGNCCNICFLGPCRLDPFTEEQHGKCDFSRLKITIADLLSKCNYQLGKILNDNLSDEKPDTDVLNNLIASSVRWISRGGDADETEGLDLFVKASRVLLDAGTYGFESGGADKIDPGYESIYCIKNEDIDINKNTLKDELQNYKEAAQNTVSSLLGTEGFTEAKDDITLVCDKPDLSIWPILCGLASIGFTVVVELPLPIKANRRFLDIVNELFYSGSGGRIIEFS